MSGLSISQTLAHDRRFIYIFWINEVIIEWDEFLLSIEWDQLIPLDVSVSQK